MVYTAASMIVWMLLSNQYKVKYDNGMVVSCYGYYLTSHKVSCIPRQNSICQPFGLMLLHLEYETIYACVYIEA